jgi:adenine-specific DNA methylase
MIPKDCKRLAEVDFPIAVVSKHAAREKSIRHGHPSTLHLWWARRPLASSRAVLLALLLPDPGDPLCPEAFKTEARALLPRVGCGTGETDPALRRGLLKFIGDFANWDLAAQATYLEVARALVRAAHPDETPLVVDPFAGGGSIPLEALRLGCEAFASDLNPVACLILKVMLEDIPRHGPGLADELRRAGAEIKAAAEQELADLYPKDPDGATPIAYLWARTVRCESPHCGAEIPLVRSFWLSKKAHRRRALRYRVERPAGETPRVEFEVFEPKTEKEVPGGTVSRAKATCVCCRTVLPPDRVRAQLAAQRGGADVQFDIQEKRIGGVRLMAVAVLKAGEIGRHYRLSTGLDYSAVAKAQKRVAGLIADWAESHSQTLCPVPNERINPIRPSPNARGLSAVTRYGMAEFGDLFTKRQLAAIATITGKCSVHSALTSVLLGFCLSKLADLANSGCRWEPVAECPRQLYARHAIPMVWDFAEGVAIGNSSGSFGALIELLTRNIKSMAGDTVGQVEMASASSHPLPDESAAIWFTDPPYYDAIPYADLSDFFLVFLKRALPSHKLLRDPFDPNNHLAPKLEECVWNASYSVDGKPKDKLFFERKIAKCFSEGRRILREDGVASVVFAHQTTEGWEAFLSGLVAAGWTVTASWPIATEMASRIRARDNASLATSIHLICRPRTEDRVGDWAEVLRELPRRVRDWMERLQREQVRGADLVFACIGPALEVFSRYARVETAEGREVPLAEYLEKVWEVVGRAALEQVLGGGAGGSGGLEEDARLTALFLWTLQSSNGVHEGPAPDRDEDPDDDEQDAPRKKKAGYRLIFDVARRFAQPLGIHLDQWEGRIIETEKGVVRLLPVTERARQLFGEEAVAARDGGDRTADARVQLDFLDAFDPVSQRSERGRAKTGVATPQPPAGRRLETTTLDRVHTAMLLQRGGQSHALRTLLGAEVERGPDFLRLANALSALYPRDGEEKRLLDAALLAVPR